MAVLRIVANLAGSDLQAARVFYEELLGLDVVMDHGWIVTLAAGATAENRPVQQLSLATEGGGGTDVPRLSIEVDNLDEVYHRAQAGGFEITYPLTEEPWGVQRFYVRDPLGYVINILSHQA